MCRVVRDPRMPTAMQRKLSDPGEESQWMWMAYEPREELWDEEPDDPQTWTPFPELA